MDVRGNVFLYVYSTCDTLEGGNINYQHIGNSDVPVDAIKNGFAQHGDNFIWRGVYWIGSLEGRVVFDALYSVNPDGSFNATGTINAQDESHEITDEALKGSPLYPFAGRVSRFLSGDETWPESGEVLTFGIHEEKGSSLTPVWDAARHHVALLRARIKSSGGAGPENIPTGLESGLKFRSANKGESSPYRIWSGGKLATPTGSVDEKATRYVVDKLKSGDNFQPQGMDEAEEGRFSQREAAEMAAFLGSSTAVPRSRQDLAIEVIKQAFRT